MSLEITDWILWHGYFIIYRELARWRFSFVFKQVVIFYEEKLIVICNAPPSLCHCNDGFWLVKAVTKCVLSVLVLVYALYLYHRTRRAFLIESLDYLMKGLFDLIAA